MILTQHRLRLWLAQVSTLLFCFVASQQLALAQVSLSLSWAYTSTDETGYGVERATSSRGPWTKVGSVAAPATSYLDTGLKYSTTYYYRVWAYDATVNSSFSGIASFKTPPAPNPVVSIVSPKMNEHWSNSVFTVSGKAGDNEVLTNVLVSLNNGAWTGATLSNGGSNWTANVTLTPGPNVVQAYAVDTSGKDSKTTTVKFVYILSAVLTVQTNGRGTISPGYNGALLEIGANYSMTARPKTGFGFVNWTDGDGNVITKGAKLKFQMESNLTFTANFVDVQKPTVSIVSPKANEKWSNSVFTVSGKAGDNVAVSNVLISLNNGAWTGATLSNGGSNWTANLTLIPGPNTIAAYAVDTSGNVSATRKVSFIYVSIAPAIVRILPPEISDLSVDQGMATISFESTTGLLYTLESKDSLTDTNWTALPVSIIGTGGGVSLTDSNAPPACRFYRVRAQAAP
jgi:hypothetical protein